MLKNRKQDDVIFKKFVQKNLICYLVPNVIINTIVPYFSFKDLDTVHLFQGEYCFARFLLPMCLLLPFIITFDILKKTIAFSEKSEAGFVLPDNFTKNKFMFKMAGVNGAVTVSAILFVMICLQLLLPGDYSFNGRILSAFLGILAGMFSVIFTLLPIKKIKELI